MSCTGAVPKIASFFLTLGSLDGLAGAGVVAAGGVAAGVVMGGESGVVVVSLCLVGVSLGLGCSGGGS